MYANDTTLSTSLNYPSKTTLNNKTTETIINEELYTINEWLNIMVRDTRILTNVFSLDIYMRWSLRERSFAPTSNRMDMLWSNKVNHTQRSVLRRGSKYCCSRMHVFRTEDCRGRRQLFASCNTDIRRRRKH